MRFRGAGVEPAFQAARNLALTRSDTGVACLSCFLWLTQLVSFAHSHQSRVTAKAGLLLALNFIPLFEGQNWAICRSRGRCVTLFKLAIFALLCIDVSKSGGAGSGLARSPSGGPLRRGLLRLYGGGQQPAKQAAGALLPPPPEDAVTCLVDAGDQALCAPMAWPGQQPVQDDASDSLLPPGRGSWDQLARPAGANDDSGGQAETAPAGGGVAALLSESKLFALLHAGLAFRYSRWRHTAALQTVVVASAVVQTAWQDLCTQPELQAPTGCRVMQQLSSLLLNAHWIPLPANVTAGGSGGSGLPAPALAPSGVLGSEHTTCKLLLTWLQLCLGWAGPIWAAVLSETYARARFAAQNAALLLPEEKEWAVMAAVGYEWISMAYQFPMLCLLTWHALLAASLGVQRLTAAGSTGVMAG